MRKEVLVSALPLPPRPDLDQLKRQAKELLEQWTGAPPDLERVPRLRDAQRAIAERYGFSSWDALRAHVTAVGEQPAAAIPRRRGLDYDDPIPDVIAWFGPITADVASRFANERAGGLKLDASTPADGLIHLRAVPSLQRLDLSGRDDLTDGDVGFLQAMPWLTAVSFAGCGRISDAAVAPLRGHQALEQVNLKWTPTGDAALSALTGQPSLHRLIVGARTTDAGIARLREFPALAAPGTLDSFLSLSSARTLTDDALVHVGSLRGVAALDVHMSVFGSPFYTARGAAHLVGMTALEMLNFHGALASDAVLEAFASIPRLHWLHCQDIVSGDAGFVALGRSDIQGLSARVCPQITDRGFAAVARLPRLRNLGMGGPRLSDAAWAPLADAQALVDVGPILSRDGAFEHIAKIRQLERLSNMYNRATTDGATRHLRAHPTLVHYHAFGTQITDESLHILAGLPRLETLEFENCAGITDAGLSALAALPRLRRVSAWSCARVQGTWTGVMPAAVTVKSEAGPPGQVEGYRAETLLDYPDLAIAADVPRIADAPATAGGLGTLPPPGLRRRFDDGVLHLALDPAIDPRWVSAVTEQAFSAPMRIRLLVRPLTLLRLVFGGHNRFLAFADDGSVISPVPWVLKVAAQVGERHAARVPKVYSGNDWVDVAIDVDDDERRLLIDGEVRHTWPGAAGGLRTRIGIGLQHHGELMVRTLTVGPLR